MKKIISFVIRKVPRKYLQRVSPIALKGLSLLYQGKEVRCPICKHQYAKFLPYGRGKSARSNALCPSCQSLERHRLLWLYFQEKTDLLQRPQALLHIAPEPCFRERFRRLEHLEYLTADLESPLAELKMDIHQIPLDSESFDVVLCNHVMEHVEDDLQAMREIHRVLKPGGWAIMQVPMMKEGLMVTYEDKSITSPTERYEAFGQEDHVRMYGEDYGDRLREAGFQVLEDRFVFELNQTLVKKYSLPAKEIIYFCEK